MNVHEEHDLHFKGVLYCSQQEQELCHSINTKFYTETYGFSIFVQWVCQRQKPNIGQQSVCRAVIIYDVMYLSLSIYCAYGDPGVNVEIDLFSHKCTESS